MKHSNLIYVVTVLISISAVAAENGSDSSIPAVTVKHRDTKDEDGTLLASVDRFYRGTNQILEVVTYRKARGPYSEGGGWRIYRMGGEPVLIEDHKKPDGDVEVRVFGKNSDLSDFEAFTRHADGSVLPVSSEQLRKLKRQTEKTKAAVQAVGGIIENSVNTHTNAAGVINDLKQKAEELKRLQGKTSDENSK